MIGDMDGEGPITNTIKNNNWKKKIKNFKLDPTLKWEFAEIKEINNSLIKFNLIDKKMKSQQEGTLNLKEVKWTIPNKKKITDKHQLGDVIFVKKKNIWKLKQYPKVNGAIISFRSWLWRC